MGRQQVWNVPYPRNPFFTGREEYLRQISALLKGETPASAVAPLALCGLGGIGKTQIAVEYAYRHRSDYQAVFWVEADSYETLMTDFVAIAAVLNLVGTHTQLLLPEKPLTPGTGRQVVPVQPLFIIKQQEGLVKLFRADQQKQPLETQAHPEASQELSYLTGAVKRWFDTKTNWLLILDNVEDLRVIKEFLPPARGGHILLTTRSQSLGELAQSVAIEKMELEVGARFLLRRMKAAQLAAQSPSTSKATHAQARAIAQELDNVPLALDQAGAYMEETGCGLAGYLVRYREQHIQLLQRRGGKNPEHPEPIATTVSLCFEKVKRDSPAAANILLLCAFLHSSGIREELIAFAHFDPLLQSVAEDLLALDAAIEILRRFSLINRISDTKTLVIHRLVQVILKDTMDEDAQRQWTERTVRLINQVLSDGQATTWQACFPHMQSCAELITQQKLRTPEAAQLLHQAGTHLKEQIQYEQAAQFFQQAIAIWEQLFQQDHPVLMNSLDALAEIYVVRGQYNEALPLLQRTLSLREQVLGTDHFKIVSNLDNLAMIYSSQGEYEEAEQLFKRALAIREQVLGEKHLDLVNTLNNLALLHMEQEHYVEAEPLLQRILEICAKVLGPNHPDTSRARKNYADLLQKTGRFVEAEALAEKSGPQLGVSPPLWNIPYPRNPFFLGHDYEMAYMREHLQRDQAIAPSQPLALSGLGGIGKTQLALEYAYRYYQDYQAVLWAQADTCKNLTSSYLAIATLLNLPEKSEQESARVIAAVKVWLQHNTGWLLILDNADDPTLAHDFLPPSVGGHVLLTTRIQATGRFARRLEVDILPTELGALFLLRRAGLLAPDAPFEQASEQDRSVARAICEELGGLPLALDQAGAYIEETGCSLAEYQRLYQRRRADLLAERHGQLMDDHPLPVATTWSLSFAQVEQKNPAAADLLRLCAFLAPDAIPEEIITQGCLSLRDSFLHRIRHLFSQKGKTQGLLRHLAMDTSAYNQSLMALRTYSLLRREVSSGTASSLSVHRLVQAVIRDQMDEQSQHQWTERAVRAVNAAFPEVEHQSWPQCDRLLPHALVCADLIAQEPMTFPEATRLLNQAGYYLKERARYTEAEPLLVRALQIREQQLGPRHPNTATSLNNLAELYRTQGKYSQAEPLYQRALTISEQQLGALHPDTATSLNNLAALYHTQGKYERAEPLFKQALAIYEQQVGALHPDTATSLNNLARLYDNQGKYERAEPLLVRTLAIYKQQLGAQHPHTAQSLNNLALLYNNQGKYEQAEPLYRRAFSIDERTLGPQHPTTQAIRANYASLLHTMGHDAEATALDPP